MITYQLNVLESERQRKRERDKGREREMSGIQKIFVLLCSFVNLLVQSSLPISFTRKREIIERKYM